MCCSINRMVKPWLFGSRMLDKSRPVVHMASNAWNGVKARQSLRVLLPLSLVSLVTIVIYLLYNNCDRIPTTPDLCEIWKGETPRTNATLWWQWACLIEWDMDSADSYQCQNKELMGNWPVCWDKDYKPRDPCLVYSFGIDNDFSFDDAMAKRGCTVYSFDPSMGVTDHRHSERVFFKNMGLGASDTDSFHPNFDGYVRHSTSWKVRTLKSIMKLLGHEKRVIDVLKIDIEVYEWAVTANIMKDGLFPQIRQFLVEWHIFPNEPSRERFQDIYDAYMSLKKNGFQFYHKNSGSRYHHYRYWNSQADMCYVNTHFKQPS
ncbi:probable methyltransferase-like protein 24 isoform X3 [Haliotis rubra]|uniref:probable methyltransferase-like protein 24 isoform X3 n=1 Tax=Haliotis rubra TaxID=36100 RepID=UPI001EE61DD2|nr:probable methyltransferase-like protein 24 isoform X3 [Haliotis rubra]